MSSSLKRILISRQVRRISKLLLFISAIALLFLLFLYNNSRFLQTSQPVPDLSDAEVSTLNHLRSLARAIQIKGRVVDWSALYVSADATNAEQAVEMNGPVLVKTLWEVLSVDERPIIPIDDNRFIDAWGRPIVVNLHPDGRIAIWTSGGNGEEQFPEPPIIIK